MTVLGLDISKWNGAWDAAKSKSVGVMYVFIKSSQATFTDILFQVNWRKAKDAGILRGAYHYMDYSKPGKDQANYLADLMDKDPGDLPPVIDFEQVRPDNDYALARSYLREFAEQLKARNYKPIIYTGPQFWATYGEKTPYWAGFPLWIANYTTAAGPVVPEPWARWTFWQYSSKGSGANYGLESYNVDLNKYDGTPDDLLAFAGLPNASEQLKSALEALTQRVGGLEQRVTTLEAARNTGSTGSGSSSNTSSGSTTTTTPPPTTGTGSTTTTPTPTNGTWAFCNASGLNVRSGPGTGYVVVGGITAGQRVKVLSVQSGWAQIESPAGWCAEKYLTYDQSASSVVVNTTPSIYATCTASGLNVRSGPGLDYTVVGGLVYGQRVKILNRQDGWAQLETPSGWSGEKYLRYDTATTA